MIRRAAGVMGVLLVLLGGTIPLSAAEMPGGPRLALARITDSKPEFLTSDPEGLGQREVVLGGGPVQSFLFSPPSWSADGTRLAFIGAPTEGEFQSDIYVQDLVDGTWSLVPGTRNGFAPLLSPDGHTVAFSRPKPGKEGKKRRGFVEFAVWLADLNGGVVRRITPYKARVSDIASSFFPDGSTLALTRMVGDAPPEAVSFDLSKGRATVLTRRGSEPVYSPDGSRIAFRRMTWTAVGGKHISKRLFSDLYTMGVDGSDVRRLTRTARRSEGQPTWDPSGQRLAFLESKENVWWQPSPAGDGTLEEINVDGTCRSQILAAGTRILGAAWQPGFGREAGPISC